MTAVINIRHDRSVLGEPDVVRIDRATRWGNPFVTFGYCPRWSYRTRVQISGQEICEPVGIGEEQSPADTPMDGLSSAGLDIAQAIIGLAGLIPGFGEPADALNAGISVARGNYQEAILDGASAIPGTGQVTGAVMAGIRGRRAISNIWGMIAGDTDTSVTGRRRSVFKSNNPVAARPTSFKCTASARCPRIWLNSVARRRSGVSPSAPAHNCFQIGRAPAPFVSFISTKTSTTISLRSILGLLTGVTQTVCDAIARHRYHDQMSHSSAR